MSITINCTVLGHSQPFWKEWEWGLLAFLKLVTEEKLIIWMENSLKYKLRLSCSFMYLQLANLLLLNMCFEYHRAASESWYLEEDYPITTFFDNKILDFFCKRTNNIHKYFEGCCVRGQVRSNGLLKSFNSCITTCIVEPWISWFRLQKNLRIYCFQITLWLDNLPIDMVRVVAL